jgi:hypothetical protein
MFFLKGKISDRIRAGKLPKDVKHVYVRQPEVPTPAAVRSAKGQGLGKGATRARSADKGGERRSGKA